MTDSPSTIPAFAPVPRRARHDGWTAARQRAFIAALAETGCVTRAAKWVGKSAVAAYQLRHQPGAEGFRAAWSAALDSGVQRLTDIAFERAIEGVPIPIFHNGKQVGERRAYNDRLLMWTLRHHDPDRYGADSGGTASISPATQARLKRQWAAEQQTGTADVRDRRALRMVRDDLVVATRLSDRLAQMHDRLDDADLDPAADPDAASAGGGGVSPREPTPRRADGEDDSPFRRELDAFDRLHPEVRDWTDADAAMAEGWPAQPVTPDDRARLAAKLDALTDDTDVEWTTGPEALALARAALFGEAAPPDAPDDPAQTMTDGAGEPDPCA